MPNYQNSIKKASHTNVDDFTKLGRPQSERKCLNGLKMRTRPNRSIFINNVANHLSVNCLDIMTVGIRFNTSKKRG
ncbi:hypothetical protein GCM10016272_10870 [Psychrobacter glaciei]|uniref:Uncharacterized protein n=1 Tax=Psychrobacter glaciei TaxID=619771 RepID=A0ABQ3GRY1_9GAMM|nr:hypothetical protein GCM10016272_10870 [Psychrobacter glaciei]